MTAYTPFTGDDIDKVSAGGSVHGGYSTHHVFVRSGKVRPTNDGVGRHEETIATKESTSIHAIQSAELLHVNTEHHSGRRGPYRRESLTSFAWRYIAYCCWIGT